MNHQREALLPDTLVAIALPDGWIVDDEAGAVTVVAPEGDIRVSFVAAPKSGSPAEIALSAWRLVDATFDLQLRNEAEGASTSGWDAEYEIAYTTPGSVGRTTLAIIRCLGERAYVSLIYGTTAGLSRRMAQIGEVIDAWRPPGLAETDLGDRAPVRWSATESDALAGFLRDAMPELKIPGAALAVVQDGAVVFAQGFGVTSLDEPRPVTAGTRFMIGSTTKSLTTLMMARLVEAGRFAWSTPVTDLLPGFALADPKVTAKVQMHHTVSAGTGMPRRDLDLFFRVRGIGAAERVAEMKGMLPTTGFGETFQYSNYLVAAGGYAAARALTASGSLEDAYEHAMRELVFEPLGMTRTTVHPRDDVHDDEAAPHALDIAGNIAAIDPAIERFAEAIAPAGAVWSTASDVARYVVLELTGGSVIETRRQPRTKIDAKSSYGLGLFLTKQQGLTVVGHGGNTLGFSSDMFFLPGKGLGVVVLTNVRAANTFLAAVRQRVLELVFGAPSMSGQMVSNAAKTLSRAIESIRARLGTDASATAWLEEWIGEYRCNELGEARLARSADGYRIDFESWGSELAVETQSDGGKLIVLTSPPWSGALRLRPAASGSELSLDGAQTTYVFARTDRTSSPSG